MRKGNYLILGLEDQVAKNKCDIEDIERNIIRKATYTLKVTGHVAEEEDLPTPYRGDYGDAYVVGVEGSDDYVYYIWTKANATIHTDHWFELGQFPIPGPQGEQGEPGRVTIFYKVGNSHETSETEITEYELYGDKTEVEVGDTFIDADGKCFQVKDIAIAMDFYTFTVKYITTLPTVNAGGGAVESVNGKTGVVILDGSDINVHGTLMTIDEAIEAVEQAVEAKQDALTASDPILINANNVVSLKYGSGLKVSAGLLTVDESTIQHKLTAGTNITISGNTISASGGGSEPAEYLKRASVSSNTLTLTKKDNTTVTYTPSFPVSSVNSKTGSVVIDATDVKLTNGTNTSVQQNIVRIDEALDDKQDILTAGTGIDITNQEISVDTSVIQEKISEYIADGSVSQDGNTLTLEKDDGTTITFSPTGGGSSGVSSVNGKTGVVVISGEDVKIKADSPDTIDDITDDLQLQINTKQGTLTPSSLLSITGSNNYIDIVYDDDSGLYANGANGLAIDQDVIQHKLTAGANITISNNVISATGGGGGAVDSVNGQTGTVVVTGSDIKMAASGSEALKTIKTVTDGLKTQIDLKQGRLTGDRTITIDSSNNIGVAYDDDSGLTILDAGLGIDAATLLGNITAGDGISISGTTISSTVPIINIVWHDEVN